MVDSTGDRLAKMWGTVDNDQSNDGFIHGGNSVDMKGKMNMFTGESTFENSRIIGKGLSSDSHINPNNSMNKLSIPMGAHQSDKVTSGSGDGYDYDYGGFNAPSTYDYPYESSPEPWNQPSSYPTTQSREGFGYGSHKDPAIRSDGGYYGNSSQYSRGPQPNLYQPDVSSGYGGSQHGKSSPPMHQQHGMYGSSSLPSHYPMDTSGAHDPYSTYERPVYGPSGGLPAPGMTRKVVAPIQPPLMYGHGGRANYGSGPIGGMGASVGYSQASSPGTGGSNAQGRAINKMLLDILHNRVVDPNRLALIVDANIERMDCVNLATLLFHTGKKRLLLTPVFIKRIATRFSLVKEELRAREASNALYGLKCMSSDGAEVRQLVLALAHKISMSTSDLVAQAVGNALYGCQMMTSDHEEVRFLLQVLAVKVTRCQELLEAQNVGNALYGLRGMNSDHKEVRMMISALTPKIATAKEDLNGQALGNSLYGLQCMSSKEAETRSLLVVLADKVHRCWENLKAQEVGNALYGLKRMNSDVTEVRVLLDALVPKIAASTEILDAQAIGNSFYGMQYMKSDNPAVLALLRVMAEKVNESHAELDGQAMGNSLYGLQGMNSEFIEVRGVVRAITMKLDASQLEMNAQELGNSLYGLQNMTTDYPEVRSLLVALARKVASSKHDLTSQEIGNALYGLQGMKSDTWETRLLVRQLSIKVSKSSALLDPQGIANSLYGFQRMSSESEEVRMLVHALAAKIEQSWKLLNAQHIANSLYGLQNLSTFEMEVNYLVRSLLPKVNSCRDEMTSKQLSCAFFGMQSMYSHHPDALSLVTALTEKTILSKESMTGLQLGGALFGLQGLDDVTPEVQKLLGVFALKIAGAKDVTAPDIGNCYFGMQRLSTHCPEVCELLRALAPHLITLVHKGAEFTPHICGNIIYGLQNCSVLEDSVRDVLQELSVLIKNITSASLSSLNSRGNRSSLSTSWNKSYTFQEILKLYQYVTLALHVIPNLDSDVELKSSLYEQQAILFHVVEARKHEYQPSSPRSLAICHQRLTVGLKILLGNEPFEVTYGDLLFGFDTATLVTIKRDVLLTSPVTGLPWNPVLNVEIIGSSHTFPAKDLFTRLRARYLFEAKGVVVEMIHASMVAASSFGKGNSARKAVVETLRSQEHLLHALFPSTTEDAVAFSTILSSQGLLGGQSLMSSFRELSTEQMIDSYRSREGINDEASSTSFFAVGTLNTSSLSVECFSKTSTFEYVDDNLESDGSSYDSRFVAPREIRSTRVMSEHWIGDHPKLPSPTSLSSPGSRSSPSSRTNNAGGGNVFNFYNVPGATNPAPKNPVAPPARAAANKPPYAFGGVGESPSPLLGYSTNISTSGGYKGPPVITIGANLQPQEQHSQSGLSLLPGLSEVPRVSPASTSSVADPVDSINREGTQEVDEIALLEAQLEIARIEARLLQLKQGKKSSVSGTDESL